MVKTKQTVSLLNYVNLGQVLAGGDTARLSDKQLKSDETDESTLRSWEFDERGFMPIVGPKSHSYQGAPFVCHRLTCI